MLARTAAPTNARKNNTGSNRVAQLCHELTALRPELFGRALRLSRSPETAEDLVQDTVERAIRFQDTFQTGTSLRAWAHQILFSVFITRCRRTRRERNALDVLATDPCAWTAPEARSDVAALSPPVAAAFRALPLNFRAVLVLVDLEEMSYKAAAKKLRVPLGTVMSRLHRGRKILAQKVSVPERMRAAA